MVEKGNAKRMRFLGRLKRRWEDNIKKDVNEICCEAVEGR